MFWNFSLDLASYLTRLQYTWFLKYTAYLPMILIATVCWVFLSIPLNTSPNEPLPILSSRVNRSSGSTWPLYGDQKKAQIKN